jgi:hypothetical protein
MCGAAFFHKFLQSLFVLKLYCQRTQGNRRCSTRLLQVRTATSPVLFTPCFTIPKLTAPTQWRQCSQMRWLVHIRPALTSLVASGAIPTPAWSGKERMIACICNLGLFNTSSDEVFAMSVLVPGQRMGSLCVTIRVCRSLLVEFVPVGLWLVPWACLELQVLYNDWQFFLPWT